jgi:DNA topoisomerase VI subunit A
MGDIFIFIHVNRKLSKFHGSVQAMSRKKTGGTIKQKNIHVNEKLKSLGGQIYDQIEERKFPWIDIRSRTSKNIKMDEKLGQYILGPRTTKRSAHNRRNIKPLSQILWVATVGKDLLALNKTSTLRDVFYMAQGEGTEIQFDEQSESDDIITDLETVMDLAREDFHIYPKERSAIFGDLTVEYTSPPGWEGQQRNMALDPNGTVIGPPMTTAEFVKCNANKLVVVEKHAMFTRFIEEGAYKKFNALLISTEGQAPRATRQLIRRINMELDLPVMILTDGDPWGISIASVIVHGSVNCAHLRELNTPDAIWAGIYASDIVKYKLPTVKMTDKTMQKRGSDTDKLEKLAQFFDTPAFKNTVWQKEIALYEKLKRKCELEAFSRYGLSFVVDNYLKDKMKEIGFN